MSNVIKPCPFCGGEAEFIQKGISGNIRLGFVKCNECGIKLKKENCTENYARDAWNTRNPIKKIVEELEEQLGNTNFEKATKEVNESYYDGMGYAYGNAIEIVKRGGVNDD